MWNARNTDTYLVIGNLVVGLYILFYLSQILFDKFLKR